MAESTSLAAMAGAIDDGDEGDSIFLACRDDGDGRSVLSVLANGIWSDEFAGHPLLSMFTMREARELRLVCSELKTSVDANPWEDNGGATIVRPERLALWRSAYPRARAVSLPGSRQFLEALDDGHMAALAGVRSLTLSRYNLGSISAAGWARLSGIRHLDLAGCLFLSGVAFASLDLRGIERLVVEDHHNDLLQAIKREDLARSLELLDSHAWMQVASGGRSGSCLLQASVRPSLIDVVSRLLEAGASQQATGPRGEERTPLCYASAVGNAAGVRLLLAAGAGADVASVSVSGEYWPLLLASMKGRTEVVKILLSSGANPNKASSKGRTPLFEACEKGHEDVVAALVAAGADANLTASAGSSSGSSKVWSGITPLMRASASVGSIPIVRWLLQAGASVTAADTLGFTALYNACDFGHAELLDILLGAGGHVDAAFTPSGTTALMRAIDKGHTAVVFRLAAAGANCTASSADGVTPLFLACRKGHLATVQMLLAAGASANAARLDDGETPIYTASQGGFEEIVSALLAAGASANAATTSKPSGMTPLMRAALFGHLPVVRMLLSAGASANAADEDGMTVLYNACEHPPILDFLLETAARANINSPTKLVGATPLFRACRKGCTPAALSLLTAGANANQPCADGCTALSIASHLGNLPLVSALIGAGARDSPTTCGHTPLMLACMFGKEAVAMYLLDVFGDACASARTLTGCTALHFACHARLPFVAARLAAVPGVDVAASVCASVLPRLVCNPPMVLVHLPIGSTPLSLCKIGYGMDVVVALCNSRLADDTKEQGGGLVKSGDATEHEGGVKRPPSLRP